MPLFENSLLVFVVANLARLILYPPLGRFVLLAETERDLMRVTLLGTLYLQSSEGNPRNLQNFAMCPFFSTDCPPGQFSTDGVCQDCPVGEVSPQGSSSWFVLDIVSA
jgi:hypothetical protein